MDIDQARSMSAALSQRLHDRNVVSQNYWDYYTGDHPQGWVQRKISQRYSELLTRSVVNFPLLIIDSVGDRMVVDGFRFSDDATSRQFWEMWQRSDMNVAAPMVQTDALVTGYGYVSVWDDGDGVSIKGESSFEVIHERDPLNPLRAVVALKRWLDPLAGVWRGYLFTAEDVAYLVADADVMYDLNGNPYAEPPTGWDVVSVFQHRMGRCPVVPFINRARLTGVGFSEIGDVIPVFDRINTLVADMLLAAEVAAFRQRWATGMEIPRDDQNVPVEPFDAALDRLWVSEDENTRFGQFEATELRNYTEAIDQSIQHVAAITRTPPFLLLGKLTNLSAEALKATESGLVTKLRQRMAMMGESWESVAQLAVTAASGRDPGEVQVLWRDPENVSEAARVDALVKLYSIGLPWRAVMERWGATDQEIARWERMRSEDVFSRLVLESTKVAPGVMASERESQNEEESGDDES